LIRSDVIDDLKPAYKDSGAVVGPSAEALGIRAQLATFLAQRNLLIAVLVAACVHVEEASMNQHRVVEEALDRLLTRGGEAFVVFEDKASGKFVQFSGSMDEPLLLDVPSQELSDVEFERARTFFRDLDVSFTSDGQNGQVSGIEGSFQLLLGQDTKRGADLTLCIFAEVFQLPAEFSLSIEEN
jgi:hypothetical protein